MAIDRRMMVDTLESEFDIVSEESMMKLIRNAVSIVVFTRFPSGEVG